MLKGYSMRLYNLCDIPQVRLGKIERIERAFIIEAEIIENYKYYFASEAKPFWSLIKKSDKIEIIKDQSPKYGICLLISSHNGLDIRDRRILVHGSNEDGTVSSHNSDNCLIPLKSNDIDFIFKNINFESGYFISKLGVSKVETSKKCINYRNQVFTIEETNNA